jgi:hypothetical protein
LARAKPNSSFGSVPAERLPRRREAGVRFALGYRPRIDRIAAELDAIGLPPAELGSGPGE